MSEHPIQGLMSTAMQSIKDMVDVNTIVGDAVQSPDGTVIIPISKVTFGFAAGGSEFKGETEEEDSRERDQNLSRMPFGGGSGAGVSIIPVAFLVVSKENIKVLPANFNTSLDKLLDFIPEMAEKINESVKKRICLKKETKNTETRTKKDALLDD